MRVITELAKAINWLPNAKNEYEQVAKSNIDTLIGFLPTGSGFDNGIKLNEKTTPNRIIFDSSFHHMNENGFYDGWSAFKVIVTPSFVCDFDIKVTGVNTTRKYFNKDFKEYIAYEYRRKLWQEVIRGDKNEYKIIPEMY